MGDLVRTASAVEHNPSVQAGRRAVFLDRDGTINREVHYLRSADQFQLIAGADDAVRLLKQAGFRIVVVTNQSGIARGLLSETQLHAIHQRMRRMLADSAAALDAVYYCPHHPQGVVPRYSCHCSCRKPMPGMLRRAATDLTIDLKQSFMIGDKWTDLKSGAAVGCEAVLVRTGRGREEERMVNHRPLNRHWIADDLWQAANWIVQAIAAHERSTLTQT